MQYSILVQPNKYITHIKQDFMHYTNQQCMHNRRCSSKLRSAAHSSGFTVKWLFSTMFSRSLLAPNFHLSTLEGVVVAFPVAPVDAIILTCVMSIQVEPIEV